MSFLRIRLPATAGRFGRRLSVALVVLCVAGGSATWAYADTDARGSQVARSTWPATPDMAITNDVVSPTASPSTAARRAGVIKPQPRTLPRIVSRPDGLYVAATGAPFIARGANYVRLARNSAGVVYHSTFEPGRYDQQKAVAFLSQMRHDGYNTARVFIDPGSNAADNRGIGGGIGTTDKIYGPYMDNVAAFVKAAIALGIYTMPSLAYFPTNSYYWGIVGRAGGATPINMDGQNVSYMERGHVLAKAEYVANFATALLDRIGQEQGTAILAYQSDNEAFFETNKAPFNKLSGTVTPFNGITYEMSDFRQRQEAADASLVEYTIRIKQALTAADPDALLAMGFFAFQAVGKTGPDGFAVHCETCPSGQRYWYPGTAGIVSQRGAIDMIDLHMYEHHGTPVLDAHEMRQRTDPYIIGEFGALKSFFGNDIMQAASGMRDLQREGCALGAKGYLFFTWDTTDALASLDHFFTMSEQGGVINGVLAPIVRPDPCR